VAQPFGAPPHLGAAIAKGPDTQAPAIPKFRTRIKSANRSPSAETVLPKNGVDRVITPGTQVFGWEVVNPLALDGLAARLEKAGVAVKRERAALADQRCVAGLISLADPAGNRLEAFYGPMIADMPFKPTRDRGNRPLLSLHVYSRELSHPSPSLRGQRDSRRRSV
jgi:hypothetical protein